MRTREGALAKFGEDVRHVAAARGWRYAVTGGKEEGLLLYLRKTRFLKPDEAVAQWNAGELDALVLPDEDLVRYVGILRDAARADLNAAITVNGQPRRYVLLVRESQSSPSP